MHEVAIKRVELWPHPHLFSSEFLM